MLRLGFLLVLAATTNEPTLPELFNRAKAAFSSGDYQKSLADFELLDANSRKPGFEGDRAKLAPVVLFYRGANLAALGRKDDAKEAFIAYLSHVPNASIASPPFPREVVRAFEDARRENTIDAAYARFVIPAQWRFLADETWIESPVRYLLTEEQKSAYATLRSSAERQAFVETFWNDYSAAFRAEFERRVAFADAYFGRMTERAAVFTILGAPNYAAVAQLQSGDETMAILRDTGNRDIRYGPQYGAVNRDRYANVNGTTRMSNDIENDSRRAMREVWYYRKDRLPAGVAAKEVRIEFITKEGYGAGVLQKDPEPMQALAQAVEAAKR